MKTLVIYYSFEGDTKAIGDLIADNFNADILELKLVKEVKSKDYMKKYLGEKQVLMKTEPLLKPYDIKVDDYDLLFIGTPIWSGTFAPALRSFFSNEDIKGKKIALFYCFTVKKGRISKYMINKLKGNEIIDEIGFKEPLTQQKEVVIERLEWWLSKIRNKITEK